MNHKSVAVFTTGGTISSIFDPGSGKIKQMYSGADLIKQIEPHLTGIKVDLHEFSQIPGPHFTPQIGLELSKQIANALSEDHICGAVVVQGTDTIDEMSFLQSLLISSSKPVVFTGAMKSAGELFVDASGNLIGAILVAGSEKSLYKGVLVYFNETINLSTDVLKYHANKMDAFMSPKGAIGEFINEEITFYYDPIVGETYKPSDLAHKVALLKVYTGMDDMLIRSCIEKKYDGIIIEGFGAGNVPPTIVDAIAEAIALGIIVVVVSRCVAGQSMGVYDYPGGGSRLKDLGAIFGGSLNGQKARMKLIVLLGSGKSKDYIASEFNIG